VNCAEIWADGIAGRNMMKHPLALLLFAAIMSMPMANARADESTVLIFSKTTGFRHSSITPGIRAITALGRQNGFETEATEDSTVFAKDNLERYAAVIFLSTTGDVLNQEQQLAFEAYIRAGGGFVGVHSATDTEYEWPWYGELVGAWFDSHGEVQNAAVETIAPFGVAKLPKPWVRRDEWYNFKNVSPHINVILRLDTHSFAGSKHGENHPIAWYHELDNGRAFYTGLGHTDESFSEPLFLAHLLDGIRYSLRR
jgi:type 1 glutamine amidotransferase